MRNFFPTQISSTCSYLQYQHSTVWIQNRNLKGYQNNSCQYMYKIPMKEYDGINNFCFWRDRLKLASKDTIIYYKESNLLKMSTESCFSIFKKRSLKGDASQPLGRRAFALGGLELSTQHQQRRQTREQQLTRQAGRGAVVGRCMHTDWHAPRLWDYLLSGFFKMSDYSWVYIHRVK